MRMPSKKFSFADGMYEMSKNGDKTMTITCHATSYSPNNNKHTINKLPTQANKNTPMKC